MHRTVWKGDTDMQLSDLHLTLNRIVQKKGDEVPGSE